ncbi:LysR family transcriptional regulator [Antarcticimicrobium sediminis]|uniref:LysR family transcriptional regulator n=1 Tax=Antarcticimicrobium sediminis TaxID=2546227 RepID=A0A4R5EZ54_9RHOB|nr:LysR family transcriptional regulator [Antarcticimicrobium sediminis]TDE40374.1 LysR family transcriptional regulator [Antarcticimicrobium sediminis]
MEPNWDDMKVFLAVAREQSLSGAGRMLKLDPATVGRRIARLEQAMGAVLFVKSPQGYALSAAGERLLAHGEAAEAAMRAAGEALTGSSDSLAGQIRIGAPDGCANYVLPQVCARIGEENPDLDLQIVALPRVVNLSRREADMAITVSPPTAGQLLVQKICDYHLHLVATRDFLRQNLPIDTLEALRQVRMVGYVPEMIFDEELDYLGALGVQRVPLASNSVSVQLRLVVQGTGVGIAHDFSLPSHSNLRKVLPDQVSLTRSFYLVRYQGAQRSLRLTRFAELLCDRVRAEVARLESLT